MKWNKKKIICGIYVFYKVIVNLYLMDNGIIWD